MPFFLFLDVQSIALEIFEGVLDFFFILDVFLNFNIAYYDKTNKIVSKRRSIAEHYLKGFFWIDLLTSIPLN